MSPRAAWRLESFGFSPVYDYVNGKQEWLGYRLEWEGTATLVGDFVTTDVPTCAPSDGLDRFAGTEGSIVVLNERRIVLGVVEPEHVTPGRTAEEAMREGPSTVRPAEELEALLHRMHHANAEQVLVTTPDGAFVGILRRSAAESANPG